MDRAAKKKEAKDEKQDQKLEEQVLKTLEEAATPDKKFELLLRKHVETERVGRRLRQDMKVQEKQLECVLREKDNLQREYNKSVLMRDKLQEVCREQQKLIKSVKNESMQKIREEEERRKESQTKFQASLNEITQSLSKNNDENIKLRDHNIEMTKKLKYLADQYHTREQQLEKLNEQVQLETQINQAKMSKLQVEAAMEKEILMNEKQVALEKLLQSQKMVHEMNEREIALKEQLDLYMAKYDDFHSSLQKSNDIFATYKVELEKMSKNTKKLERESLEWKRKWEKSNATLIELATEKKDRDDHAARCTKQVDQLQKLLRALQHERTHLYKVMRENNVECPSMPPLPPEPEPLKTAPTTSAADKDKMEIMSQNCAELKQTLAHIQNQVKFLNLKMPEVEPESKEKVVQHQEEAHKKRNKKKQKSKNRKNSTGSVEAPAAAPKSVRSDENKNGNEVAAITPNGEEKSADDVAMAEAAPTTVNAEQEVSNNDAATVTNVADDVEVTVEKTSPEEQPQEEPVPKVANEVVVSTEPAKSEEQEQHQQPHVESWSEIAAKAIRLEQPKPLEEPPHVQPPKEQDKLEGHGKLEQPKAAEAVVIAQTVPNAVI